MLQRPTGVRLHRSSATAHGSVPLGPRKRRTVSAGQGGSPPAPNEEDMIWTQQAFPSYLQNSSGYSLEVCREFDRAVTQAERDHSIHVLNSIDADSDAVPAVWQAIRREAERDAAAEPLLSSFLYASILAHDSFERALAFVLANRLANAVMLPTQLFETFYEVLNLDADVREGALADVEACRERDPACTSYSQALLYYKGFHAIQTHRIAHSLLGRGQKVMAMALQSRMSEVLAVDIHPAARIGKGILLDHGTGVVIGETAVIGNNVSLLQNVTLGGTGKEVGDRHPKVSDNVLIGASATVLGNITIGKGAQIAAGSLVLKPVPPHTMVAGSPGREVGTVSGNPALNMQQWSRKFMIEESGSEDPLCDEIDLQHASSMAEEGLPGVVPPAAGRENFGVALRPRQGQQLKAPESAYTSNGSASSGPAGGAAAAAAPPAAVAAPAAAGAPQESPAQPAEALPSRRAAGGGLKGVAAGDVDVTLNDTVAERKWPPQRRADPEYNI